MSIGDKDLVKKSHTFEFVCGLIAIAICAYIGHTIVSHFGFVGMLGTVVLCIISGVLIMRSELPDGEEIEGRIAFSLGAQLLITVLIVSTIISFLLSFK